VRGMIGAGNTLQEEFGRGFPNLIVRLDHERNSLLLQKHCKRFTKVYHIPRRFAIEIINDFLS
jgi:hypothetical protein